VTEERGTADPDPDDALPSAAGADASGRDPTVAPATAGRGAKGRDPVRLATLVVLAVCAVFFALYVWADRVMPYSDQARVSGYTVPIVPQVSGYITHIAVGLHEEVEGGDVLVEIDTVQYRIAVRSARAQLDNAIQQVGGGTASVQAAAAGVAAARAQEAITLRDFERISSIRERDPTAISQADRDRAEAAHLAAVAQVEAAQADLRRAEATLGPAGLDNPSVRAALAALEQAELNLARATIRAPSRGAVESLFLDVGYFAAPGQPLLTFVSTAGTWITADMRENNLQNLRPGTPVEVLLDVAPGRVFDGVVRSVGLGVDDATPSGPGSLPTVSTSTGWLRQPQQFPVIIDVAESVPPELLRIGAQASVMAFTGDHWPLNPIGRLVMRLSAYLSYLR
jgi:multidrug resistance efflux pump